MDHYLPFGPVDQPAIIDTYNYEDVKESHCEATVANNICNHLLDISEIEDTRYMTVCLPCYNEDLEELLKTIVSLMENFEFMQRKARLHDDALGLSLDKEFKRTRAIIVPIFDGTRALSPTMKAWLQDNFPGILDDLSGESELGKLDVRISCSKWWYYCDDTLITGDSLSESTNHAPSFYERKSEIEQLVSQTHGQNSSLSRSIRASSETDEHDIASTLHKTLNINGSFHSSFSLNQSMTNNSTKVYSENIMYFHICPIVKKNNHRKHNSHQWFFDAICEGLDEKVIYAFLTDCGTTYKPTCLGRLLYELHLRHDLIGVTARQRVETPNIFFRPCEESNYKWLQGDHSEDKRPCWKCQLCYYLSPAPLQGFEFEATLIMNSAMFNLVEALPVMPGPCQLLHWQKMKQFKVINEYFNLLFKGESKKQLPKKLPKKFRKMQSSTINVDNNRLMVSPSVDQSVKIAEKLNKENKIKKSKTQANNNPFTYTEFLRVNMRLAEDRILSFVCVFSTGYGTKWIPGSTFFYRPELHWNTLLTQRRRWLNGTFASFLFFFKSQRAQTRINGGMFDNHKAGKNIRFMNALWSLQLLQLLLVLVSPAVFGSACYIGLLDSAKRWPAGFDWAKMTVYGDVRIAECWVAFYLFIYATWAIYSFYAPRGKIPEWYCNWLAVLSTVLVFPIYFAIWYVTIDQGVDIIGGLVIATLVLPIFIAMAQSVTCALLYIAYLPWFLCLILFFLVFIPSYSFARLWDTTWGNRSTGKDSAIGDAMEKGMKSRNFIFLIFLVALNIALVYAFVNLFRLGYTAIMTFMVIVFFPMIVQLVCSFLFLFIVVPLRNLTSRDDQYAKRFENVEMSSIEDSVSNPMGSN